MILSQDEQNVVLLFVFIVLKKNLLFIFWGDKRDEQSIHFFFVKKRKKKRAGTGQQRKFRSLERYVKHQGRGDDHEYKQEQEQHLLSNRSAREFYS